MESATKEINESQRSVSLNELCITIVSILIEAGYSRHEILHEMYPLEILYILVHRFEQAERTRKLMAGDDSAEKRNKGVSLNTLAAMVNPKMAREKVRDEVHTFQRDLAINAWRKRGLN